MGSAVFSGKMAAATGGCAISKTWFIDGNRGFLYNRIHEKAR